MPAVNEGYLKLASGYLFPEIARRVKAFQKKNPKAEIIRLGIGDVVLPIIPAVIAALHRGVDEMARQDTFKGYGPEQGYPFLINAIIKNDYKPLGIRLKPSEIFISDGSKCDTGNIQEIFSPACTVAVTDPVYPVYADSNIMAGRKGLIVYLPMTSEGCFIPPLPKVPVDVIYLCSPNNPTGIALQRASLAAWVDYARKHKAIILFDAAYEAYIHDKKIPHSIYEIPGADSVAIEFRSFSKTAGFTGLRCAYTVVPEKLTGVDSAGKPVSLNSLWLRRQTTKFNGVSYPVQKGAEAVFSPEGKKEIAGQISYYMENAKIIREGISKIGLRVFGGINAPYVWVMTPGRIKSWDFFDKLLNEAYIVSTPGSGFGPSGEGYVRLSAFAIREQVVDAVERIGSRLNI